MQQWFYFFSLVVEYSNCLHTTWASFVLQPSSHTVPQVPLLQISTLPSLETLPSTSLTLPCIQTEERKCIHNDSAKGN